MFVSCFASCDKYIVDLSFEKYAIFGVQTQVFHEFDARICIFQNWYAHPTFSWFPLLPFRRTVMHSHSLHLETSSQGKADFFQHMLTVEHKDTMFLIVCLVFVVFFYSKFCIVYACLFPIQVAQG